MARRAPARGPPAGSCSRSESPRGGNRRGRGEHPRARSGRVAAHAVGLPDGEEHRDLGAQRVRRPGATGASVGDQRARARRRGASGPVRCAAGGGRLAEARAGRRRPRGAPARGERGRQRAPPLLEAVEAVDEEHRRARAQLDRGAWRTRGRYAVGWGTLGRGRRARTRRPARLLRRRRPRHRDRRAGARGARPAGVRARRDRAQHARRGARSRPRARCSWTARARCPRGETIILSAHGVSPEVRRVCDERDLRVIDATCPLVSKVHAEVRRYAATRRDRAPGGPRRPRRGDRDPRARRPRR